MNAQQRSASKLPPDLPIGMISGKPPSAGRPGGRTRKSVLGALVDGRYFSLAVWLVIAAYVVAVWVAVFGVLLSPI